MKRSTRNTWVAAVAAVTLTIACGGGESTAGKATTTTTVRGARPSTTAQLRIVSPTDGQVVKGPTVKVKLEVTGATIISEHDAAAHDDVKADEVHLHLSVDGRLVSMTFGDDTELNDLTPGPHTLKAEVVAGDHAPFANEVEASTSFIVE
jgi:hypothetical protein